MELYNRDSSYRDFHSPHKGATGVPINQVLSATFSEAMNCATVTTSTFTLTAAGERGGNNRLLRDERDLYTDKASSQPIPFTLPRLQPGWLIRQAKALATNYV